jgi:hypothetical protein
MPAAAELLRDFSDVDIALRAQTRAIHSARFL